MNIKGTIALVGVLIALHATGCNKKKPAASNPVRSLMLGKWHGRASIRSSSGKSLVGLFETKVEELSPKQVSFHFKVSNLRGYAVRQIRYWVRIDLQSADKVLLTVKKNNGLLYDRIPLPHRASNSFSGERSQGAVTEKGRVDLRKKDKAEVAISRLEADTVTDSIHVTLTKQPAKL